jgi:putative oxidoreductase
MAVLKKARVVFSWILQVIVGIAFMPIGLGKFSNPMWVRGFERWGYPDWFRILIGVVEVACGLLLLVPRLTSYAALLLVAVMIGALATHAMAGQDWIRPVPHMTILLLLAWLRWPSRWRSRHKSAPGVVPSES